MIAFTFLVLCIPTAWELYDDRNGDYNKKDDVALRAILMLLSAQAPAQDWLGYFIALNLSIAIFFLFFDYLINIILNYRVFERKVNWFSNVGKSSFFDQLKFWRDANPWLRFTIKAAYFTASLLIFLTHGNL